MGLDNIPKNYPCMTKQTAVRVPRLNNDGEPMLEEDGTILMVTDCKATQEAGGCPYVTELNKQDKKKLGNPVYGMFGTDCWYRGKWGNHLLQHIGIDDDYSFYGDSDDETEKSPESCINLAEAIDEALLESCDKNGHLMVDGEDVAPDLRYAEWYLKWASEHADGLICWY